MKYYIVVEKNYKPFTYEYDLKAVKKIMPIKDYSVVIMFSNNEFLQLDRVCSLCVK